MISLDFDSRVACSLGVLHSETSSVSVDFHCVCVGLVASDFFVGTACVP